MPSGLGDTWRRCGRWVTPVVLAAIAVVAVRDARPPARRPAPPIAHAAPVVRAAPPPAIVQLPVAGYVVDSIGQPIERVRVTLRDASGTQPDAIAESEADGAFRLESGRAGVLLFDAEHVFPAEVTWHGDTTAPKITLARRATIQARALIGGKPVVGAEVRITDGSQPTLASATTDRDGLVRFSDLVPGPYEIWATHAGAASPLVRIEDVLVAPAPIELVLEPAGGIAGQVIADGALPAGSIVQLEPIDLDHAARFGVVDEYGRFAIDGVPNGRWRIECAVAGFVQSAEQIVSVTRVDEPVVVQLDRAGIVSGTVVDAAGGPVANATIVLRRQGVSTTRTGMQRPLTSARLRWVHPLAGKRYLPGIEPARFGASRPGSRPAECGAGHCGVDLGSQRGLIVHAAADGEIVGAYTELRGEAGRYIAIDHGGGLRTMYMHLDDLREGLEVGQKVRGGDPIGTVGTTGILRSVPHLHFAFTQERHGRTVYLDPEPMLRHAVVLAKPRALERVAIAPALIATARAREVAAEPAKTTTLVTDAQGAFRVDGLEPGPYVAIAFAPELAPGASPAFAVASGTETSGVTVTLNPGVMVRGRVAGPDGPINGATIIAGAGFGETESKVATAYTDAQGEFVLRALAGKVTLSVTAPGHGGATRALVLDEGGRDRGARREDFKLVIEDAQLRGQVLAPDGLAAGVTVRIVEGPTRRTAITDAQGHFTIEPVARGRYVVELASPEYPPKRASLAADRFAELRLDAGGGVRFVIRDAMSGEPLAASLVETTGPDGRTITRTADSNGVVELRGLAPGAWTATVRTRGYVIATQEATIRVSRVIEDVRVELARSATLAGVVRDRRGTRVAGARVWLGTASTQADADGNFSLVGVPIGPVELHAELGARRGALPLQLGAGDDRSSLTIELAD